MFENLDHDLTNETLEGSIMENNEQAASSEAESAQDEAIAP